MFFVFAELIRTRHDLLEMENKLVPGQCLCLTDGETWQFPSQQMFYNALQRKGKGDDVQEEVEPCRTTQYSLRMHFHTENKLISMHKPLRVQTRRSL